MSVWKEQGDSICERCGDDFNSHLIPGHPCPGPSEDEVQPSAPAPLNSDEI